jgi:tetratricopeptide (TPR) repeat protein
MGFMASPSLPANRSSRVKRTVVAVILLLLTVGTLGYSLRRLVFVDDAEPVVRRALAAGRIDEASKLVEQWLRSSPRSAAVHYFKAKIAWLQNDLPTVDDELGYARALGYSWAPLASLRGLLLSRVNKTSEAEPFLRESFDNAQRPDPEVAEALVRVYLGTFRLGDAAAVLDQWTRQLPEDARPYLLRTEIDVRNSAEPEDIIAHYRASLERDPTLAKAHLGLAEQLRMTHRFTEAAGEYAIYLASQPDDALACAGAGKNALDADDFVEADRLLGRAVALAPDNPEVLAACATLQSRQGHLERALLYFDQAIKADPFDHWTRYQRMLLLSRLGKKVEANAERQTVEQLKNDVTRFAQISRELLQNPVDPQLRSEAARWLMEHGHEDEAVEWANLVLRSDPTHPAMNRLLADYYRRKGRLGLANLHQAHLADPSPHPVSSP